MCIPIYISFCMFEGLVKDQYTQNDKRGGAECIAEHCGKGSLEYLAMRGGAEYNFDELKL